MTWMVRGYPPIVGNLPMGLFVKMLVKNIGFIGESVAKAWSGGGENKWNHNEKVNNEYV